MAAMALCIWKYGFLKVSPGLTAEKILHSINDLVLLYDMEGAVVYRNRKAREILGASGENSPVESLLLQGTVAPMLESVRDSRLTVADKVGLVTAQPAGEFSDTEPGGGAGCCRVNFRAEPLYDRFRDPLGILVTGSVVLRLEEVLMEYGLTRREAEVLEYLLVGWTSRKVASVLRITERTVKAHISSIYEKTGAGNRVELMNLVGTFEEN